MIRPSAAQADPAWRIASTMRELCHWRNEARCRPSTLENAVGWVSWKLVPICTLRYCEGVPRRRSAPVRFAQAVDEYRCPGPHEPAHTAKLAGELSFGRRCERPPPPRGVDQSMPPFFEPPVITHGVNDGVERSPTMP